MLKLNLKIDWKVYESLGINNIECNLKLKTYILIEKNHLLT